MFSAASVYVSAFVISGISTVTISGQNYAERSGSLRTSADIFPVTDNENDFDNTEYYYYDWSHDETNVLRWNVEDYPHPQMEPAACRRKKSGNLCDPDGVLSQQQADKLETFIRKLYNDTICICSACDDRSSGIQIGIALLKRIYQPYGEHPSKVIHSFSKNLRTKWKLGACDDDVLIVVVTEDRQSFTDVGIILKQYISLNEAYTIFVDNKAYFTAGNYFEGLKGMLKQYHQASKNIAKDSNLKKGSPLSRSEIAGIVSAVMFVIFFLIIAFVFFYRRYKRSENSRQSRRREQNEPKKQESSSLLSRCFHYHKVNPDAPLCEERSAANITVLKEDAQDSALDPMIR